MPDLIEIAEAYAEAAATLQVVGQNAEAARLYRQAAKMHQESIHLDYVSRQPGATRSACIKADQCLLWARECMRAEFYENQPTEGGIPT